jgi:hypothetical protein
MIAFKRAFLGREESSGMCSHTNKIIDAPREAAILAVDWKRYLLYLSRYISHFFSKYVVTPPHFNRVSYDVVSENVGYRVAAFVRQIIEEQPPSYKAAVIDAVVLAIQESYKKKGGDSPADAS